MGKDTIYNKIEDHCCAIIQTRSRESVITYDKIPGSYDEKCLEWNQKGKTVTCSLIKNGN